MAAEKIRRACGLEVSVGRPQVAYRETVVRGVFGLVYRHVKQDGGAGQFAHVVLDAEPAKWEEGEGFVFRWAVAGGHVPREYIRAVEAGCRDALAAGPLGGHPVTGLRVTLTDGAMHPRDSSEMAFRTAGPVGLREALRVSVMRLLEPVAVVVVTVPDDAVGGVLGDLVARRGHVTDSTIRGWDRDRHRDRATGRAIRLREPSAQPHPGPGHLHPPARRLRARTAGLAPAASPAPPARAGPSASGLTDVPCYDGTVGGWSLACLPPRLDGFDGLQDHPA